MLNIGHAINAALATDPSNTLVNTLVISFDWANAFNTFLFEEVLANYPSRCPSYQT